MASAPRVILIVESSRAYGRGCLSGIAAYIRAHGPWRTLQLERALQDEITASVRRWPADGVIARIETPEMAQAIGLMKLPTVDLRGSLRLPQVAAFDTDATACARLAAAHLMERGFRHLAFCGFPRLDFSDRRCETFQTIVEEQGFPLATFAAPQRKRRQPDTLASEAYGETHISELVKWLRKLPKPVGIFACNDVRGRQVLHAAKLAELHVPDEVAVIGVDNDTVICDLSDPPLTSIEPNTHRLGYLGAEMLERMIGGEPPPVEPMLVPPVKIEVRRSSDTVAIEDAQTARAIRFIREHACEFIGVDDVAREAAMSRATLERRFAQHLSRTPRQEIERVRLERVKRFLMETDYKLGRVAELTAFRSASHLATVFRQRLGLTPGEFRNGARNGR